MSRRIVSTVPLLTIIVLMLASSLCPRAVATFCQISNISYSYPQQVMVGQSFTTTVTVSGICAADDADYYSIRADLNDMSGLVLSEASVPIGFSQGQRWTVSVQDQITAPAKPSLWRIEFAVYIFAAIGSGGVIDSITFKPVAIQVGTLQIAQTFTSAIETSQTQSSSVVMLSTTVSTVAMSTQSAQTPQPSLDIYGGLAIAIVLIALAVIAAFVKQRLKSASSNE